MRIEELLLFVLDNDASSLILLPGCAPLLSIDGIVAPLDMDLPADSQVQRMILSLCEGEIDVGKISPSMSFSKEFPDIGRFRINIFKQNHLFGAVLRRIPHIIPQFSDLGLPGGAICNLLQASNGLVIVTGPAGSGRSTTIAGMLNYLNETYPYHIVTLENPIEYVFKNRISFFDQRNIPNEQEHLLKELKWLDHQDVHAVMVQGVLSSSIIEELLHTAEMGRLVIVEFPSPDILQCLEDIIFSIDKEKRSFFTNRFALILKGVISQRLLPKVSGRGRSLAHEFFINIPESISYIRDLKLHQLLTLMESNTGIGMQTLEMSLSNLYMEGQITEQTAFQEARRPQQLKSALRQLESKNV